MSTNHQAALRYNIIDECLNDFSRKYNIEDLQNACRHLTDDGEPVSRRTIQYDIKHMKSGLLGDIAPIIYIRGKGFRYSREFSIYSVQLEKKEVDVLMQAFSILTQLTSNAKLGGINTAIKLIEKKLATVDAEDYDQQHIFLEPSTNKEGHKWIDQLYKHCVAEKPCRMKYNSFHLEPTNFVYSPYYLKEYNGRWYVIAYCHEQKMIHNVPLDRIETIIETFFPFLGIENSDDKSLFGDYIGVTREAGELKHILIKVSPASIKFLERKPLHHTQKVLEKVDDSWTQVCFDLKTNYEFYYKILAYGSAIVIESPVEVRTHIQSIVNKLQKHYKS